MTARDDWKIGDWIDGRWQVLTARAGVSGSVHDVFDHELQEYLTARRFAAALLDWDSMLALRLKKAALPWIGLDYHPNCVQARFVQTVAGQPVLFLQQVPGDSLAQWQGDGARCEDLLAILRMGLQLCDGMEHATSGRCGAHRSLTPRKCLVTEDGTLKISDFGVARALDEALAAVDNDPRAPRPIKTRLDLYGLSGGSAAANYACAYLAPEQFIAGRHVDVRADIYAVGIMLYELVSGQPPFRADSVAAYAECHRHDTPALLDDLPPDLARIIQTCLAKEAPYRFVDFALLRKALAAVYAEITGNAAPRAPRGAAVEADRLAARGLSCAAYGKWREAVAAYDAALEHEPALAQVWSHKGLALGALEDSRAALECHDLAIDLDPLHAAHWARKGATLRALERFAEALICLEQAIDLDPCYWRAWLDKGLCQAAQGDRVAELGGYDRALALNPQCTAAWRHKAIAYRMTGSSDKEIASYDQILRLEPHDENAWYDKGLALGALGRHAQELECYDRMLAINPDSERAWTHRGIVLGEMGRLQEEIACYDRALAINRHYSQAWYNKGVALVVSERLPEALTCLMGADRLGHPRAAATIAGLHRGSRPGPA